MAASMYHFPFPPDCELDFQFSNPDKLCVVSVVGKSPLRPYSSKADILNPVLDREIFKGTYGLSDEQDQELDLECCIDASGQTLYLHYRCIHDAGHLVALCGKLTKEPTGENFNKTWQSEDLKHAKMILYLFSVSHIVLLCHPGNSFDISYVRLFRTLDNIRMKIQPSLTELLQDLPVSKEWYHSGRLCSPRVLFIFESCLLDCGLDEESESNIKSRSPRTSSVKRLQHSLEDQIYRILRKSRIITNISNNSLFAVPPNQEFVYVFGKTAETSDPVQYYLNLLHSNSPVTQNSEFKRSRSYQANRRANQDMSEPIARSSPTPLRGFGEHSFKEFLWQHMDLALTKGFNDNIGRHNVHVSAIYEITNCETWMSVATKLYDFFFTGRADGKAHAHFNTLRSLLETERRFSENRCNKVLPLAEASYIEGLPQHYTTSCHLSKLLQAKKLFSQRARGLAYDKYIVQLEDACEKYWKNGHQLCEECSLSGNHCINPRHRLPEAVETDVNRHLPELPHNSSQIKTRAACNCGRKQNEKDDSFDHKAANYDFFQSLEDSCCGVLEHITMPVFVSKCRELRTETPGGVERSEPENIPGALGGSPPQTTAADVAADSPQTPLMRDALKSDVVGSMASLSLALSLGQSGSNDLFGHMGTNSYNPEHSPNPEVISQTIDTSAADSNVSDTAAPDVQCPTSRQVSTTEYLPSMIHSQSPPGLLPKFSSWSLCCLGKSSQYIHSQGLDLPGFLHGSNFLLPWDITVRMEKEKWPTVGETGGKKGKPKRVQKESGEVTVRVYLGNEYECPRGHRFFCSGPEKIIKVSSSSTVKDNAIKLVTLDMPLYCPCHCRSPKGHVAQLMRVYTVTPEAHVRMLLKPRVQPAPPPCPQFHPGLDDAIELPTGGIWALRLPSVYVGEYGIYSMPTDLQNLSLCVLVCGVFDYVETTPAR